MIRRVHVKRRRRRRGRVGGGEVETVNSIVVGEGRRVVRYGVVVSIMIEVSLIGVLLLRHCW